MARVVAVLALLSSASAFAPTSVARSAKVAPTQAAIDDYLGADVETAGLWDPWGFSKNEDKLYRYRCVELKHGRIAMLAVTGNIFAELFQLPGYLAPGSGLKFADVPQGIAALPTTLGGQGGVPIMGWVQIVFFIGCLETQIFKQDPSKAPGDIAPDGWKRYDDPVEKEAKLTSELKNGRLAMMAIMGQLVQQKIWGEPMIADMLKGHFTPL